ncbi:hypothetical protein BURC_03107 [Burkholderiaceae bacterium]|nr:hypothetical protein BURC_03107 [Burkholderiaceae bacterium]
MGLARKALSALAAAWLCLSINLPAQGAQQAPARVEFADERASNDVREVANWVIGSRDHRGRPFVIVDKNEARAFVFAPQGRLIAATPVLLGAARGDHSVPGVGELPPALIPVADRTTPAGRFATEPGRNLSGEDVVWFDYDAGLAIHRLRPSDAPLTRAQRLASERVADNRVSAGCVVVPVSFYEGVIAPIFGRQRGVVYVLPEMSSAREMFGAPGAEL